MSRSLCILAISLTIIFFKPRVGLSQISRERPTHRVDYILCPFMGLMKYNRRNFEIAFILIFSIKYANNILGAIKSIPVTSQSST